MPAKSLPEIKNMAPAVERALFAAFESVGGKPVIPRSREDNDEVHIIPNFNLGPAQGHVHRRPDGQYDYDLFQDCTIEWEMSVPRMPGMSAETLVATYDLFSQELTRISLSLDPARWEFINGKLPFHKLTRIIPRGFQKGLDAERGEDRATSRWACWLGILPDAWPTDLNAYRDVTG